MSSLLEGSEQLERELTPEPMMAPAAGAVALHIALGAVIVVYGILGGFFHHSLWGAPGAGGAIQVNLVSSAIPLPSSQPVNQNVLATETPSQAPAEPEPKAKQAVDENAIPILGKKTKPQQKTAPRTPPRKPEPVQNNRAQYGEQAGSSMPRSTPSQGFSNGPTTISNGDFGSLFGWYVDGINRKMSSNGFRSMVDPHTAKGLRAYIFFKIYKDGSAGDVQLERSSGSSTLDLACVRAAQRVDTFGTLPREYRGSFLQVSYYCEY
jgi:periplasmic protein TonB